MIGIETKQKLKDLFLGFAEGEIGIEKLRQILASIKEFEPYSAFKRIDRDNSGYITAKKLCQFIKENGYREYSKDDLVFLIRYFDQDKDLKLDFHDFLQILLPCEDAVLRAAASQRPVMQIKQGEFLSMRVERALTQLIVKEANLQIMIENYKRSLESSYDYSIQGAFKCIDDWNYGYIDKSNLKKFLRQMGYIASKMEIVSIIRRFDTDGDAKVNLNEFQEGLRSALYFTNPNSSYSSTKKSKKAEGISSSILISGKKLCKSNSKNQFKKENGSSSTPVRQSKSNKSALMFQQFDYNLSKKVTPNKQSFKSKGYKKRPSSANKVSGSSKQRQKLLESAYGEESKGYDERSNHLQQYQQENSPSKLNKSVTFNQQVRVREYDNNPPNVNNFQQQSSNNNNTENTPVKNLNAQLNRFENDRSTPPPLRDENLGQRSFAFEQRGNINNSSPLKSSHQKTESYSINQYEQLNGSPLIIKKRTIESQQQQLHQQPLSNQLQSSSLHSSILASSSSYPQSATTSHYMDQMLGSFDLVEKGEIAKVFKDTIFLERELESVKIELCLKPDFNVQDAFKMLDVEKRGYLTAVDLSEGLNRVLELEKEAGIIINRDDLFLIFRRYDSKSLGQIAFSDFCNLVMPQSKDYAALLNGRQEFYSTKQMKPAEYFNSETRHEIRNLFKQVILNERASECLRVRLTRRPNFNLKSAFMYTDKNNDNNLSSEDIRTMLADHGFFATERELTSIMKKFDKDLDQRINFSEFVDELTPKTGQKV